MFSVYCEPLSLWQIMFTAVCLLWGLKETRGLSVSLSLERARQVKLNIKHTTLDLGFVDRQWRKWEQYFLKMIIKHKSTSHIYYFNTWVATRKLWLDSWINLTISALATVLFVFIFGNNPAQLWPQHCVFCAQTFEQSQKHKGQGPLIKHNAQKIWPLSSFSGLSPAPLSNLLVIITL